MSKILVLILCIASAGAGALGARFLSSPKHECIAPANGQVSDAERDFWRTHSTRGGAKGY